MHQKAHQKSDESNVTITNSLDAKRWCCMYDIVPQKKKAITI
jgi:hypothetical protein